jgi:hypothetical protein
MNDLSKIVARHHGSGDGDGSGYGVKILEA